MGSTIGVVGIPDLARHFERAGFEVITGHDFRDAATAVRRAIQSGAQFPVVVCDSDNGAATPKAVAAWVQQAAKQTTVIAVRLDGASGFDAPAEITAPARVADLLDIAGFVGQSHSDLEFDERGIVHEAAIPLTDDDVLLWEDPQQEPSDSPKNPCRDRGKVIVIASGKGGSGKSSMALTIGQHAASTAPAGFRVTVVDANRSQGDLRIYLRLWRAPIPTIHDFVVTGDPGDALVTPSQMALHRDSSWGPVDFAFVAAPPEHLASDHDVPVAAYNKIIDYARSISDLVVIDTQINEAFDHSGLWGGMLVPLLVDDAWAVSVTDPSSASITNHVNRSRALVERGVDPDRMLWAFNRVNERDCELVKALQPLMSGLGHYVGAVESDPEVDVALKTGRIPVDNAEMRRVALDVLHRVTGLDEFIPEVAQTTDVRRGLLGRWRR